MIMKVCAKFCTVFAIILGFTSTGMAVSSGQVAGQVIEIETLKPVEYAEIIFENYLDKIVVNANEYGYYYADHIPTGKYQIRVVFNNRTFVMNHVRVYDYYSNEVNFRVSSNNQLPSIVEIEKNETIINSFTSTDINLTYNSFNQPTQSLSDALITQPGVDIRNGKIYIKGSDQVRFFIDGTPIMGQPVIGRIW